MSDERTSDERTSDPRTSDPRTSDEYARDAHARAERVAAERRSDRRSSGRTAARRPSSARPAEAALPEAGDGPRGRRPRAGGDDTSGGRRQPAAANEGDPFGATGDDEWGDDEWGDDEWGDATGEDQPIDWPQRPDWWPDPPDARDVLDEDDDALLDRPQGGQEGRVVGPTATVQAEQAVDEVEGRVQRPHEPATGPAPGARRGAQERSARRESRHVDPPTLPGLPNQWAQLPPTVPHVPEAPHGIRRSTVLLIVLWVAVLIFYLWVRPVG